MTSYKITIPEDKSPVLAVSDGFLLNPESCFPITAITSRSTTAQKVKSILERSREMSWDEAVAILADLVYRQGIRFKELDLEIQSGRAEFTRCIEPRDAHTGFAVARLILLTWMMAFRHPVGELARRDDLVDLTRYRVHGPRDKLTCSECESAMRGNYVFRQLPKFPVHFGCRCTVLLDTSDLGYGNRST